MQAFSCLLALSFFFLGTFFYESGDQRERRGPLSFCHVPASTISGERSLVPAEAQSGQEMYMAQCPCFTKQQCNC